MDFSGGILSPHPSLPPEGEGEGGGILMLSLVPAGHEKIKGYLNLRLLTIFIAAP